MAVTIVTKNGTTGTPTGLADGELAVDRAAGKLWVGNSASVVQIADGALKAGTLAQFAATTSAQLAGVISDETGTGSLVFGTNPTLTGATLAGELAGADNTVSRVNLKDYGEVTNAIGSVGGGTQDIDLTLGNVVSATVDTSATTFTFSNPTASDECSGFTLYLVNGGSQTVTWPASVDWPAATAPTLTASGTDKLVFETIDGGTTWLGNLVGAAYA